MNPINKNNGYTGYYYTINDLEFMEALSENGNRGIEGPTLTLGFYLVNYKHTDEVHDDLSWQVRNRVYHYKRKKLVSEPSKLLFCLSERGMELLEKLKEEKVDYLHKLKDKSVNTMKKSKK